MRPRGKAPYQLLFLPTDSAEDPVKEAQVEKVTSSSSNDDIYRLYYSGGTDDKCNGGVRFFLSKAGSEGIFNKTFTLATTGLVSGLKVSIFSYTDSDDCDSAITIELSK